jgi:hypothetical protein
MEAPDARGLGATRPLNLGAWTWSSGRAKVTPCPSWRWRCRQGDKVTPPRTSPYIVVGAGIHGLSTAYHLAKELRMRGLGSGADIVVLDKSPPGAGASGIACGVVRNNYFQPAMSELMRGSRIPPRITTTPSATSPLARQCSKTT